MKVLAAIVSAILATAIGISSTYYVMTHVLEYRREPDKGYYESTETGPGNAKKGKGPGMGGGKGGKGKFGKGGAPGGGKDGKNGAPNGT